MTRAVAIGNAIAQRAFLAFATLTLLTTACSDKPGIDYSGPVAEWRDIGGDKGGLKYSPLTQVNRANVKGLKVAWVHRSGDWSEATDGNSKTVFQVTPLVVGDTLYYCSPYNRIFALDAESGKERWVFDPAIRNRKLRGFYAPNCRGVSYWADPQPGPDEACRERIFEGTMDSELIAVDAKTGKPCAGFGKNGRISLRQTRRKRALRGSDTTAPMRAACWAAHS